MRPKTISRGMIVDAALSVINEKGLAHATTRAIVRAVPCSEGSLYLHFADRTQLLVAVIAKAVSGFSFTLVQLGPGGKPAEQLLPAMRQALGFYRTAMPVLAGVMSDLSVLRVFQHAMRSAGRGPNASRLMLAGFIAREQAAGRLESSVQPERAATLLLYAAFGRAFEEHFTGRKSALSDTRFCKISVAMIMRADPSDWTEA